MTMAERKEKSDGLQKRIDAFAEESVGNDHPDHALFCELEFDIRLRGTPASFEGHKDFSKITKNSTELPVNHVLIYGSLYPTAVAVRTDFRLSSGEQAAYIVVTR